MPPALRYLLSLFVAFLLCQPQHGLAAGRYPFTVSAEKRGNGHELVAHNRGPAWVSVRINPREASNVVGEQPWPAEAVVPPNADSVVTRITPAQPDQKSRFSFQIIFRTGDVNALHDPAALYRLPYPEGMTFIVSQAAGGPSTTHKTPDSQYAIDFIMPESTPILAARDGVVIELEDGRQLSGQDSALLGQANRVRIQHDDHTIATYSHLSFQGVRVRIGERVAAGSLIGLSGSTGYSSGPHLHFVVNEVMRKDDGLAYLSVPLRFYVGQPAHVFTPQYLQAITADYSHPGQEPPFIKTKRAQRPVE